MRYGKEFKDEAISALFNGQTENGNSLSFNQFLEHLESQKERGACLCLSASAGMSVSVSVSARVAVCLCVLERYRKREKKRV